MALRCYINLMRVKSINLKSFRRFHDLTITELPSTARLVVMAGPNGTGKSSLFDGFKTWHQVFGGGASASLAADYHLKIGDPALDWSQLVTVTFHDEVPGGAEERQKLFYIRSAYRNEADFSISQLQRLGSPLGAARISRLIDNDVSVSENYQRLVSLTLDGVYSREFDNENVATLRESFIGVVRDSMKRVFPDLLLEGIGDPLTAGTFTFEKGSSKGFPYKNLSGGEKAAFDLLLDLIIKRSTYDDTIYCVDEPELHMNTRLQAALLHEMCQLIPESCQLWVASHSIGMMRAARDIHESSDDQVVFLDFGGREFDEPQELRPVDVDREFWARSLDVALDDLARLVAPVRVVLCEGSLPGVTSTERAEFDARCFRRVFSREFPDTDFISVGNAHDVQSDRLGIGRTIQALITGTKVLRVVDRDDRSPDEVERLRQQDIRVLTERTIESYLLSDEMLEALCRKAQQLDKLEQVIKLKADLLTKSESEGRPPDDMKRISGDLYVELKRLLSLTAVGNTKETFMSDTIAPLMDPSMETYKQLKADIFGSAPGAV